MQRRWAEFGREMSYEPSQYRETCRSTGRKGAKGGSWADSEAISPPFQPSGPPPAHQGPGEGEFGRRWRTSPQQPGLLRRVGPTYAAIPLGNAAGRPMMARFRKKPVVVEAAQWDGTSNSAFDVAKEIGMSSWGLRNGKFMIETLEGEMAASQGDWIIKGTQGEFYPCKPHIFEEIYEPADG